MDDATSSRCSSPRETALETRASKTPINRCPFSVPSPDEKSSPHAFTTPFSSSSLSSSPASLPLNSTEDVSSGTSVPCFRTRSEEFSFLDHLRFHAPLQVRTRIPRSCLTMISRIFRKDCLPEFRGNDSKAPPLRFLQICFRRPTARRNGSAGS